MLGRLKELTELNGVSGNEKAVRKYIRTHCEAIADEMRTDTMGNLVVHKKGDGRKIMICAHMDEVGMMVRAIKEDGLLAYSAAPLPTLVTHWWPFVFAVSFAVVPSSISAKSGFTV